MFLIVLEAGKANMKALTQLRSGEGHSWFIDGYLLTKYSHDRRDKRGLSGLFNRALIPLVKASLL